MNVVKFGLGVFVVLILMSCGSSGLRTGEHLGEDEVAAYVKSFSRISIVGENAGPSLSIDAEEFCEENFPERVALSVGGYKANAISSAHGEGSAYELTADVLDSDFDKFTTLRGYITYYPNDGEPKVKYALCKTIDDSFPQLTEFGGVREGCSMTNGGYHHFYCISTKSSGDDGTADLMRWTCVTNKDGIECKFHYSAD